VAVLQAPRGRCHYNVGNCQLKAALVGNTCDSSGGSCGGDGGGGGGGGRGSGGRRKSVGQIAVRGK